MVVLLLLTVAGKADAKPADVTNLSAVTEKYIAVLSWKPSPSLWALTISLWFVIPAALRRAMSRFSVPL